MQPCAQPAYQVIISTEIGASALTKRFLSPNFTERGMGELTELGDLLAQVMGSRLDEPPGSQGSLNSLDMQGEMGSKDCVRLILFFQVFPVISSL